MLKVLKSEFVYSVPELKQMIDLSFEIAFVGRSNSGKSSLINAICHKKDLARTSKTPGRTRHAVVYKVVLERDQQKKNFTLVDLPGFGYATMSKGDALACEKLIYSYVAQRKTLKILFLLMDIRRMPDEREWHIVELARLNNIHLYFILTKCDKISTSARKPALKKIAHDMGLSEKSMLLHSTFSEETKITIQEVIFKSEH
jgi:GTP-binding protein